MTKRKKLQEIKQIDGKVAGGSSVRTLDSLIGGDISHPYRQNNENDYSEYLSDLNSTDLHRHAEKVGLVPTSERRVLKDRLLREFRKFIASRSVVPNELVRAHTNQDSSADSLSPTARRILREGA